MKYLFAYVFIMAAGWAFDWTYFNLLIQTYILISILLLALLSRSKGLGLVYRSTLALLFINSIVDCFLLAGWIANKVDASPFAAVLFLAWYAHIMFRQYDLPSDKVNLDNVLILVKKPKNSWDFVKSLIGLPVASICIRTGNQAWAFRHKSGEFENVPANFLDSHCHVVIDTGVGCSEGIIEQLKKTVGTKRGIGCKCVWSIRKVLNMVGGKYAIKSWLDYIPGFYVMRLLWKI